MKIKKIQKYVVQRIFVGGWCTVSYPISKKRAEKLKKHEEKLFKSAEVRIIKEEDE